MTGLDCLREEMKNRGLNNAQCNSKVTAVVLDILANAGNEYQEAWEGEQRHTKRLSQLKKELYDIDDEIQRKKNELLAYQRQIEKAKKNREDCEDYIDKFNKILSECETPEGRDAMKIAQMFVNSVSVDTRYDNVYGNTSYIIGLVPILSDGKVQAIQGLKKINKKLPVNKDMVTI